MLNVLLERCEERVIFLPKMPCFCICLKHKSLVNNVSLEQLDLEMEMKVWIHRAPNIFFFMILWR